MNACGKAVVDQLSIADLQSLHLLTLLLHAVPQTACPVPW